MRPAHMTLTALALLTLALLIPGSAIGSSPADSPPQPLPLHLYNLSQSLPGARITVQPGGSALRMLARVQIATQGATPEARAADFLQSWGMALGLEPHTLTLEAIEGIADRRVASYSQHLDGVPVIDRAMTISMDGQGRVVRVQSDLTPIRQVWRGPLSEQTAAAIATQLVWGDVPLTHLHARPAIVAQPDRSGVLVWVVHVPMRHVLDQVVVLIDSRDGAVIELRNRTTKH